MLLTSAPVSFPFDTVIQTEFLIRYKGGVNILRKKSYLPNIVEWVATMFSCIFDRSPGHHCGCYILRQNHENRVDSMGSKPTPECFYRCNIWWASSDAAPDSIRCARFLDELLPHPICVEVELAYNWPLQCFWLDRFSPNTPTISRLSRNQYLWQWNRNSWIEYRKKSFVILGIPHLIFRFRIQREKYFLALEDTPRWNVQQIHVEIF